MKHCFLHFQTVVLILNATRVRRSDAHQQNTSELGGRAAHRNHTIRFVRYGCTGKTPVLSRLLIYKLTAVNIMAVNRIDSKFYPLYGGIRVDSL